MKPVYFESAAEFGKWLAKHHKSETELLVGFHKKATGRGMSYKEALDQALAYGWIDGVRKRVDDEAYTIRFTPRKPGSVWSVVNTKRVKELIAEGRMKSAGLRVFEERDAEKTRQYSYEREQAKLGAGLETMLRGNSKAWEFFEVQPPGYRKVVTHWIVSAKQEETRARRMDKLIEHCVRGVRIDFMKSGPDRA
jgi:uncharacterized protein YdeI (YjbR/CyaY-like superfamily)